MADAVFTANGSRPRGPTGQRVAVLSLRRVRRVPWVGGLIDAEDVLVDCLDAKRYDLVARTERWDRILGDARAIRRLSSLSPATRAYNIWPRPVERVDLLVIIANDLHDLALVVSTPGWDTLADRVLVHLAEVSERHLRVFRDVVYKLSKKVDFVFVGSGTVAVERFRSGRVKTVGTIIPLLDVLRFPGGHSAGRPIDVLSFGRRSPSQHEHLVAWAAQAGAFYLYDTGPQLAVWDVEDHRARFVAVACRSRFVLTNHARFDEPVKTGGLRVMGTRFLEAAAAGAVLCGARPTSDPVSYEGLLDALEIVPFGIDAHCLPLELTELLSDPVAAAERGRRVRAVALDGLDVAHQWTRMVRAAGLPVAEGIQRRLDELSLESDRLLDC